MKSEEGFLVARKERARFQRAALLGMTALRFRRGAEVRSLRWESGPSHPSHNEPVNIHDLGKKVHAQMRNPQSDAVFLRCDETVPFGTFATVVDALRTSGIENVSVVTEPLSARPKGP